MSLPAGLTFVGNGVRLVFGAPEAFVQGVGVTAAGALTFNAGVPTQFPSGIPCGDDGGLCAVGPPGAAPPSQQNGMTFDATNRIITVDVSVAVAPISSQNGFNFDANGSLVTSG